MSDPSNPPVWAPKSWPVWLLIAVVGGLLLLLAFQLGGRWSMQHGGAKFAVVDLAGVVRQHQEASISALAEKGADDNSRARALAQAKAFGKQLDHEVGQLSSECGCVLLVREAVVAGQLEDLTPALMARLSQK